MRRLSEVMLIGCVGLVLGLAMPAAAADCPPDSVRVGTTCLDKYEASVWKIAQPWTNDQKAVVDKILNGTVEYEDLLVLVIQGGAIQLGLPKEDDITQIDPRFDFVANGCPLNGSGCKDVYAVSARGTLPSRFMTWFQAAAAARNSLKRLPTNAEWQTGALGTPDPTFQAEICNIYSSEIRNSGSAHPNCRSNAGAFDMVGNVAEYVADWVPRSTGSGSWGAFSDDHQGLAGADTSAVPPGALIRGGAYFDGAAAGVFAVDGGRELGVGQPHATGFRAAR